MEADIRRGEGADAAVRLKGERAWFMARPSQGEESYLVAVAIRCSPSQNGT